MLFWQTLAESHYFFLFKEGVGLFFLFFPPFFRVQLAARHSQPSLLPTREQSKGTFNCVLPSVLFPSVALKVEQRFSNGGLTYSFPHHEVVTQMNFTPLGRHFKSLGPLCEFNVFSFNLMTIDIAVSHWRHQNYV